ncbi:Transforming acidic coiled-coil-containing protein [Dirofilaria immitis]
MSSPDSDSSSETYTISGSSSTRDEEEMVEKLSEKSIQAAKLKKQFKFMSAKPVDGNESSNANLSDESGMPIQEMVIMNEANLLEISTESDTVLEACNEENSKEASNAIISDELAIRDKTELKPAATISVNMTEMSTSIIVAETAAFQEEIKEASPSSVQGIIQEVASVSKNSTENLASSTIISLVTTQPVITADFTSESSAAEPCEKQASSSVPVQTDPQVSESNPAQTCTIVSESLAVLASVPNKNSTTADASDGSMEIHATSEGLSHYIHNLANDVISLQNSDYLVTTVRRDGLLLLVISGGTAARTETPKTVRFDVMEKDKRGEIVPKEEQQPSEIIGMKSKIRNKVGELENMEASSGAFMDLPVTMPPRDESQNSAEGTLHKVGEPRPTTAQFETPRKPAPSIDSRTITRPSKTRTQQLAEAAIVPLSKTTSESVTANMLTANTGQPLPPPVVTSTSSYASPPSPQVLGQQSTIEPRPQIIQQLGSSRSVQQQQRPTAAMTGVTQPTVVPPKITPCVPVINTSTALISNSATALQDPLHNPEISQREERKSLQRVRQRTVTVQSQVSLDITTAYNEVKQMNSDDPATELVRRVQAIVAAREKEWSAKNEKLTQLLTYEQRRNEPLEQKAAERLLAMAEYEKLVQEFVEELKKKNSDGESKSVGRPGPERNWSPDDVTQLLKERDQLAEEVNSLETSYSELFRRYEKLRQTSVEIKRNEESVKSASEEVARRYSVLAEKFEMLRRNAEEQLDLANNEIDRLIKQHEADTLGLRLKVKHQESKINSLTMSLEARQKELESMTAIFEEVITKAEANDAGVDT